MDIVLLTSSYPLHPDDSRAAAGLFVRDLATELARHGHRIRVLTQAREGTVEDDPAFEVTRYAWNGDRPLSELKLHKPGELRSVHSVIRNGHRALESLIARRRPDLILALWAVPAGLFAKRASKRWGIPYRVWTLGSDIWGYGSRVLTKPIVRAALNGAEKVFADGVQLAKDTGALTRRDVHFLPSSRFLPLGLPRPGALDEDKKNFLFIGRYHVNKGPDILLEAVSRLDAGTRGNCRFFLFGGGEMEPELHQKLDRAGLAEIVSVQGYAERAAAAAYLQHCHCLIIPSRIESIPVVLSDAARCGCPLIVTDVGDMGELVRGSGAGLVAAPEPGSLKDRIREMAQSERERFSEGLRSLSETFSLEKSARVIVE